MIDEEAGPETTLDKDEFDAATRWERYQRYPYLLAKLVFFVLVIGGVLWVLNYLSGIVFPLFMAMLLAYLLNPLVGKLSEKGVPRTAGILIIITSVIAFVVVFVAFLYPTIADQVRRIGERAPQAWQFLEENLFPWLGSTLGFELPETWGEIFEEYGEEIRNAVPSVAESIGDWTGEVISRTQVLLISLFNLIMIPVFTFYFLRDFEKGRDRVAQFVPLARREIIMDRIRKMDFAVGQWFRGQIEIALILAVCNGIALTLVYWATGHDPQSGALIGILTGLLNVIPYVGFTIGTILAVLVVLIEWTGWWALIGVIVSFTLIQLAETYYITPRVMGDKIGLTPVTVIIVLIVGGQVAGFLGVLLAIPITGAIKVLLPDLANWYRRSTFYNGIIEGSTDLEPITDGPATFENESEPTTEKGQSSDEVDTDGPP